MHVHLSKECRVTVEGEMRKCGHQKVLAEDEFLDGRPALVRRVVNEDVRKHSNARECIGHAVLLLGLEIKELPLVSDEVKTESIEPRGVFFEAWGRERGKFRFIVRADVIPPLEAVKDGLDVRQQVHARINSTGHASNAP